MLVKPIDYAIRNSLRNSVFRHQPVASLRQRLLQKAATRAPFNPFPEIFRDRRPVNVFDPLDLGWRELALAQIIRPAGSVGSMMIHLR
ncbi:MAG: hypothetical protein JNL09_02315 [Anaerolineales bacterium]|nr:hypothetical protein [Anaerolineales bacterium]